MLSFATLTALMCIAPTLCAQQEQLADALHAVTDKCLTRESHDQCTDYASQQLSSCSPDDINCQRAKLANISQYCRSVCDNSDYVADATRSFLGPQQLLMKRSAQEFSIANNTGAPEQATSVLNVLSAAETTADAAATSTHQAFKTSDLIEASALKRILEASQVPANMSAFLKANLDPILAKAKAEISTVIENSQIGSKDSTKSVSKRAYDDETPSRYKIIDRTSGREVNLPDKYLISKVPAEKYTNEDFDDCKSDIEQSPARRPDRSYSEYYAPMPVYKENFYGDEEPPKPIAEEPYRSSKRPDNYEDKEEKEEEQAKPESKPKSYPESEFVVTMYVDAPVPIPTVPATPQTTSTVTSKTTSAALLGLDRLKSKLNIHQVVHNNSLGWNNSTEKHHGQHYNSTAAKAAHNAGNTLIPSVNLHLILVGLAIMAAF